MGFILIVVVFVFAFFWAIDQVHSVNVADVEYITGMNCKVDLSHEGICWNDTHICNMIPIYNTDFVNMDCEEFHGVVIE